MGSYRRHRPPDIATLSGVLDLDDLGTCIREVQRAERSGAELFNRQNAYSNEWTVRRRFRLHRSSPYREYQAWFTATPVTAPHGLEIRAIRPRY